MDWGTCVVSGVPQLSCVPVLFQYLVNGLLAFVGTFAVLYILFAGIRFITAHGDPKALETARKTFFYAIIGTIFVLLSFLIINLLGKFTGVTCINNFGFNCP